ncbi:TPA: tyrosine-type recombinase/integrase [Klebsiella pneumoniae]|jgi:integrase|uniref:tyrosine-type recombinase/integrase n=1 Tax=Klebsiella TaxID=570 RepID=UPI0010AA63F8|nr:MULTISPECIES: tyrosine-type recombinase/integrase [Klebsiella]MCD6622904.1 tyrosine-type recombinase/integrase [Klebsiella michiganensis]TIH86279.1 integrase [Klebsiella pneumoniae]VAS59254.1 phage integrase family site-specific recombinase [Klebsiella pneumoniae]HBQ0129146.1 tyrosine-type recombinase/integrase [Klebsiella pneumoniae]HBQ0174747.1 tyrosine-type recombinase/integrase [Klebsiella pneumoniae]
MSAVIDLQSRVNEYLAERRRLGFDLHHMGGGLASLARFVAAAHHSGPLTIDIMVDWVRQDKAQHRTQATWARRLELLRPFARWMRQFDPTTEVPDESIFGPIPGRVTPRLIASTGLRVSEAMSLVNADVDLVAGTLTVRKTKFTKSRMLPLHPSTVQALLTYRRLRSKAGHCSGDSPFFIGTRGQRHGQPLSERQVHRVFLSLRSQMDWVDRGCHGGPRIHDLRHSFAVRRVILWHQQGINVDQAMLSLSTYLGHAKISNTYWYLTGVPELMALAGNKFADFAQAPEFGDE